MTPPGYDNGKAKIYGYDDGEVNKAFAGDVRLTNSEGAVLVALSSFESAKRPANVEDYYSDEKDYEVQAYRYICGVEEGCVRFGEIVFVYTPFIDQTKFDAIACEMAERKFFTYHHGYEELFCRSVYVFADRFRGFIKARGNRKKNVFVAPVLGKDSAARVWIYFADFIVERIEGFVGSLIRGWRRNRRVHRVYSKYRALLNFDTLRRNVSKFSETLLYYINIIESRVDGSSFSDRVIESLNILLNIFKTVLKYIDRLVEPFLKFRIAETAFNVLKKIFGCRFARTAANLALKYAAEIDRTFNPILV